MKKILIMSMLLVFSVRAFCQLSSDEKTFAIDHLKNTLQELNKSVEGLTEAQWNYKEDSTRWSIKECVYHLALSETNIWEWLQGVMAQKLETQEAGGGPKVSDESILAMVEDRSKKATAGESFQPGKGYELWKTQKDALAFLAAERAKHADYLSSSSSDFRSHITAGPTGQMDAYQIVLLMSAHTTRHTKQIEEVKKAKGFPGN